MEKTSINVACPTCARVATMNNNYPVTCRGEGTIHAGHHYRMMTLEELRAKLDLPTTQKYPVAVQRTRAAIAALEA